MAPTWLTDKLLSWAVDLEPDTREQAARTARLPIVRDHVALMPDAHLGIGATVGSVVGTEDAVIPAAVGVDLGCGMVAVETDRAAADLPDDLDRLFPTIERAVPSGVGRGHDTPTRVAQRWLDAHPPASDLSEKLAAKAAIQFGTLGSGNHFVEVCLDERDRVWVLLHSGSRGVGNELASGHIRTARSLAQRASVGLEDPDLASFVEGTPEFAAYIGDMLWAQDYAAANRDVMTDEVLRIVLDAAGGGREVSRVNCHHNYCVRERHRGRELWVTRKGAIRAGVGELGVIPGSMGARSFVVRGLGNPDSFESCSHGAGRRLSRRQARKQFRGADLEAAMTGRAWLRDRAGQLVDEHPGAYKDIDEVMAAQRDLVEVVHELRQVLNYKGT
jgi:tRNA-splicing ligase RtcB